MGDETTNNTVFLTLGAAAKHTGLSKATLSRAIKDGKLSAQKCEETNSFKIHPAELDRYRSAMQVVRNTVETQTEERPATPDETREIASETAYATRLKELRERDELEMRAKLAEERLRDLKAQLDEIRGDRDQWREQAQRLALPAPEGAQATARRGLFGWFKRAG